MAGAEARDALALSLVPGVGPVEWRRRLDEAGSAAEALRTVVPADASRALDRAERALERAEQSGIRCLVHGDADYPAALVDTRQAPPVLWARGRPALAAQRQVAIVGTRNASSTGLRVAQQFATACAESGVGVVSGLALGIDGAAHRGALEAGGTTIAVLGTGVDVPYPPRHRALQERIAHEGLLLSEVLPGDRGHAGTFPQRNRLIAALAELTIVVEAGQESGALITARVADELHKPVAAVPGSVLAPECVGSNALVRDGALVFCSPDDLRLALGVERRAAAAPRLEGDAAECWDALQRGAADVATLAQRAALDVRRVTVAMAALELHGLVHTDAAGLVHPTVIGA